MPTDSANRLPESTGLNLGSASQRWDIFANDVDIAGTLTGVVLAADTNGITVVDGTTYAATGAGIQAAINDSTSALQGIARIVFVPTGTYTLTSQLVVKENVILQGAGPRNTVLKADASFPINTALVRIGEAPASTAIHSTRVENLLIDASNISGSIGIYSANANEQAGVRNVVVKLFTTYGIHFDTAVAQNFHIWDVETFHSPGATTAEGIRLTSCPGKNSLRDITVNSNDGTTMAAVGIRLVNASAELESIHSEDYTDGILFDGGNGMVMHYIGNNATNSVRIGAASSSVLLGWINKSTDTNTVVNDVTGRTLNTDSVVTLYSFQSASSREVWHDSGGWHSSGPVFTQVVATASLPAAAAAQNGSVIIEDAGAGDRNLIIYAGGQRFRLDGGAAF